MIFLTEDDPRKVINASLKNLARYFNELERGLVCLQDATNKHLQDIDEFQQFKKREKGLVQDVKTCGDKIEEKERNSESFEIS